MTSQTNHLKLPILSFLSARSLSAIALGEGGWHEKTKLSDLSIPKRGPVHKEEAKSDIAMADEPKKLSGAKSAAVKADKPKIRNEPKMSSRTHVRDLIKIGNFLNFDICSLTF